MPRRGGRPPRAKACPFRAQGIEYIDYKDLQTLKRYLNERGKIRAPRSTGVSPQYQRMLAEAIKNAREMALLPYSVR